MIYSSIPPLRDLCTFKTCVSPLLREGCTPSLTYLTTKGIAHLTIPLGSGKVNAIFLPKKDAIIYPLRNVGELFRIGAGEYVTMANVSFRLHRVKLRNTHLSLVLICNGLLGPVADHWYFWRAW